MQNHIILLWHLIFALAFIGCASINPLPSQPSVSQRYIDKNYTVGMQKSVYVGEPIIKYRDYTLSKVRTNKMSPSNNFTVQGGLFAATIEHTGSISDKYEIIGTTDYSDERYYIMITPSNTRLGLLIDGAGNFSRKGIMLTTKEKLPYSYELQPMDTKFKRVEETKVLLPNVQSNFDLVYTGIDKDSIKILYREYTGDDLAKPAFYQNLTYDNKSKFIRFRQHRIEVLSADSEKITYKVLEDRQ